MLLQLDWILDGFRARLGDRSCLIARARPFMAVSGGESCHPSQVLGYFADPTSARQSARVLKLFCNIGRYSGPPAGSNEMKYALKLVKHQRLSKASTAVQPGGAMQWSMCPTIALWTTKALHDSVRLESTTMVLVQCAQHHFRMSQCWCMACLVACFETQLSASKARHTTEQ